MAKTTNKEKAPEAATAAATVTPAPAPAKKAPAKKAAAKKAPAKKAAAKKAPVKKAAAAPSTMPAAFGRLQERIKKSRSNPNPITEVTAKVAVPPGKKKSATSLCAPAFLKFKARVKHCREEASKDQVI
jgi:hypothetical protein